MGWTFSSDTVSNSSRLWGQDTWKTSGEEGLSYQLILLKKWNPAPEHSASALLTTIDPEQSEEDCEFDLIGDGTGGPGGGGHGPPTFSRLTHPLLPYARQKTMNLSILPVYNSLPSVLSQKHASFIAALLEIDCFCLLLSIIVSSFSRTRNR